MRKNLSIFILLIFFACGNKNHQKPETAESEIFGTTEFEFTEEMHNFGLLQSGEIAVYSFDFKNTGNTDLILKKIESDCGCVRAEFSKEPLPPGEFGYIEIEFDSSGLWGKIFKFVEIYANTEKPKQLAIFADVQNEELEIKY